MVSRTIASFLAYKADGGGTGIPLLAKGATGLVYLAAADSSLTNTPVTVRRLEDGAAFTPSSNVHGQVPGFKADALEDSPGIWYVSGSVSCYQPFMEGMRGLPGTPGSNSIPTDEAVGVYMSTPGTNTRTETKALVTAATVSAVAPISPDGGARAVGKGEIEVSVTDHGALGNGSTDNTAAVNQAVTMCVGAFGQGGRLFFPPGEYVIHGEIELKSNLEIYGHNATLRKTIGSTSYVTFVGLSKNRLGYGGGVQNVYMHDLTFRGDLANSCSNSAMSLHRARGVNVERCRFLEMSQNGHVFDLMGCEDVTIVKSEFRGIKVIAGREYTEAIQIDSSVAQGVGFSEANMADEVFDGTPTRNVTVDDCVFGGITVDGVFYPGQNPMGSHAYVEGKYYESITFSRNLVQEQVQLPVSAPAYYGMLHFTGARGVNILTNRFVASADRQSAIRCFRGAAAMPLSQVNNRTASTIEPAVMSVPQDIKVDGNTFVGFSSASSTYPIIEIYGNTTANAAALCSVSRNHFVRCAPSASVAGVTFIVASLTYGLKVADNTADACYALADVRYSIAPSFTGNIATANGGSGSLGIKIRLDTKGAALAGNILLGFATPHAGDGTSVFSGPSGNVTAV